MVHSKANKLLKRLKDKLSPCAKVITSRVLGAVGKAVIGGLVGLSITSYTKEPELVKKRALNNELRGLVETGDKIFIKLVDLKKICMPALDRRYSSYY